MPQLLSTLISYTWNYYDLIIHIMSALWQVMAWGWVEPGHPLSPLHIDHDKCNGHWKCRCYTNVIFIVMMVYDYNKKVYAPSQWETTLHCNVASHWLGTYIKDSLHMNEQTCIMHWSYILFAATHHVWFMMKIFLHKEHQLPAGWTSHEVSSISLTFVGNQIVDHSDVVGESPVGAAPTTSSFST